MKFVHITHHQQTNSWHLNYVQTDPDLSVTTANVQHHRVLCTSHLTTHLYICQSTTLNLLAPRNYLCRLNKLRKLLLYFKMSFPPLQRRLCVCNAWQPVSDVNRILLSQLVEMGRRCRYDIRPKPKIWPSSPHWMANCNRNSASARLQGT